MSNLSDPESDFSKLLSKLRADDTPNVGHQEELRNQILTRFEESQIRGRAKEHSTSLVVTWGREIMRRPVSSLLSIVTASLVIFGVWLFIPGYQSTALGFHEFAKVLVAARSAHYQSEVTIEGQAKQKGESYYLAPGKNRIETLLMTTIVDGPEGKMMMIQPLLKTAVIMDMKGKREDQKSRDFFERVRELLSNTDETKDSQYVELGEREINGKRATGFRMESPAGTITLWGDPQSGHPVRIETLFSGSPRTEVVMSDFEIDIEIPKSKFDLTPPEGYMVQTIDVDVSKPGEKDFIDALKFACEIADGKFPAKLDILGLQHLLIKHTLKKKQGVNNIQATVKDAMILGRGFQYVLEDLPESADAHYAGKGVESGMADRPVFWYKPIPEKQNAKKQYRVIYGDFSVRSIDNAPDIPNAQKLWKKKSISSQDKPTTQKE